MHTFVDLLLAGLVPFFQETPAQPTPEPLTLKGHTENVWSIAFSPDGRLVASGGMDCMIRLWDAASGVLRETLDVRKPCSFSMGLTFSPDSQSLYVTYGPTICQWKIALPESKVVRTLLWEEGMTARTLALSPDGTLLAAGGVGQVVRVWETATGRLVHTLPAMGAGHTVKSVSISDDGKTLAAGATDDRFIRRWELATGRALARIEGPRPASPAFPGTIDGVAFIPETALLAAASHSPEAILSFWSVEGKEVMRLEGYHTVTADHLKVTQNGRFLTTIGHVGQRRWVVRLLELASGREAFTSAEYPELFTVAISRDGRKLAWGNDKDVLLLDMTSLKAAGARTAEALWKDLADGDGRVALRAMFALAAAGTASLDLLKRPFPDADPTGDPAPRVRKLIADLAHDDLEVREESQRQLELLGDVVETELQLAAKQPSVAEQRERIERLLNALKSPVIKAPEILRASRAVQVVEWIGSPKCREILRLASERASSPRVRAQAAAALKRLQAMK